MEKDNSRVFIVLEEHMQERYAYIIDKYNFKSYNLVGLQHLLGGVSLSKIKQRISSRGLLETQYNNLVTWINAQKEDKITEIYLSNSEGFIAYNIITRLKKDFPEFRLVALQHGIFDISPPPKQGLRNIVNKTCKLCYGFYPIGTGFGTKIVDKYIVYNKLYKDFLVNENNWKEEEVDIDFKFLKSHLYDKRIPNIKEEGTVVFLLQCLSKAKLCTEKEEIYLINGVTAYLSSKYNRVLIKEHPIHKDEKRVTLLENCEYVDNLIEAFNIATHAYSFTSTALIEAQIFDIKSYSINSDLINLDQEKHDKIFENIISFEKEIENK